MTGLLLTACSPDPGGAPPSADRAAVARASRPCSSGAPPSAPGPVNNPANTPLSPPRYANHPSNGIRFQGVSFDSRSHRLQVVDQPDGPGSRFPDAAALGRSMGALAAVNGGFFTPEGKPLGLVVSAGKPTGTWNSASSLGSAVWSEDQQGQLSLKRRSGMAPPKAQSMHHLLQAGPLLLENGLPVRGLSNRKTSARTFLLWDGQYRWWIGISSPTTLAQMANTLATTPPTPWKPRLALNLDGGRSSEIWVSATLAGQIVHHRPIWNRPVRNFLILKER